METQKKLTANEIFIFTEIKRRIKEFKHDKNEPLLLLAYPNEVKTLISKKLLKPYSKEVKRVKNWYNLTELGKEFI